MPATGSSSCRLPTSVFRMRIDWPRDRAACGSFFDPNSTISTTATIRIFHGLSNRSPIMSVLLLGPGWNEFGPGRPADGSVTRKTGNWWQQLPRGTFGAYTPGSGDPREAGDGGAARHH